MVLILYIIVLTSHMIVLTITLLDTLNFYLLFKFNIYIYIYIYIYIKSDSTNITYVGTYITFDGTN